MREPLVSIVLSTYNSLQYLQQAVDSVVQQTVPDWELIVIDDGSSDGTKEWLASITDSRVHYVLEPHCANLAHLRNRGVAASRAPWIAFLDADDMWLPEKLERQLALHQEFPEFGWSYTGRSLIDADSAPLPDARYKPFTGVSGWILKEVLSFEAPIASPTMMAARQLLDRVGPLNERYRYAADHLLRLDLASASACGFVDQPLVKIRLHTGSRTYRNPESDAALADVFAEFATRAPTRELSRLSRSQEVTYRVWAARHWTNSGEYVRAGRALVSALVRQPFRVWTLRNTARWLVFALTRRSAQRS